MCKGDLGFQAWHSLPSSSFPQFPECMDLRLASQLPDGPASPAGHSPSGCAAPMTWRWPVPLLDFLFRRFGSPPARLQLLLLRLCSCSVDCRFPYLGDKLKISRLARTKINGITQTGRMKSVKQPGGDRKHFENGFASGACMGFRIELSRGPRKRPFC